MRGAGLLLGVLLLGACGGPGAIPEVDLQVRVVAGRTTVETGAGFPLTVTRVWRKDIEPSPWDDGMLAPLVVRDAETTRREDRLRVEETRTFRAHVFTREDVTIPPVPFVGRSIGGTGKLIARSAAVPLTVVPTVKAEAPGEPELPDVPQPPERPLWPYALLGLLTGAAFGLLRMRRRGAADVAREAEPVSATPAAVARTELDTLGAGEPAREVTVLAGIVRRYVGAQLGVPVRERTSLEILASVPPSQRSGLEGVLAPCDRVKFAGQVPSAQERDDLVARTHAFLQATSGETP